MENYPEISIKPEEGDINFVNINHLHQYVLLIEILHTTFKIKIYNTENQDITTINYLFFNENNYPIIHENAYKIEPKNVFLNLSEIYTNHPFLNSNNFSAVIIIVDSKQFCFVPKTVFKKEYNKSYLNLSLSETQKTQQTTLNFEHAESINIYSISEQLYEWFLNKYAFCNVHFTPKISTLIEKSFKTKILNAQIYCENKSFMIVITNIDKLLFTNTFNFETAQDMLFYLMSVVDNLKINPTELAVNFEGNCSIMTNNFDSFLNFFPTSVLHKFENKIL